VTLLPMTNRQVRGRDDLPRYDPNHYCAHPDCDARGAEVHHVWRRSFAGDVAWVEVTGVGVLPNLVRLCRDHHADVTSDIGGHRAWIRWVEVDGVGEYFWCEKREGEFVPVFALVPHPPLEVGLPAEPGLEPGAGVPPSATPGSTHLHPGDKCPTCERKVPHPRKATSPESVVVSLRVPADEKAAFDETLEAFTEHLGVPKGAKYGKFKVLSLALGAGLMDESLKGFAKEGR
jgi:hypothetical protein